MAVQIQVRRDTSADWTADNPTPAQGEWCLETDTDKMKIGDGVTAWTSLAYEVEPFAVIFGLIQSASVGAIAAASVGSASYAFSITQAASVATEAYALSVAQSASVNAAGLSDPRGYASAASTAAIAASDPVGTAASVKSLALQIANNGSDVNSPGLFRENIHVPILSAVQTVATASVSTTTPGNGPWNSASVNVGNQILLTAQPNGAQNGVWSFNGPSSALTRATDYASGASVGNGRTVQVTSGTYANTEWMMSNPASVAVVDTTATTWTPGYSGTYVPLAGAANGQSPVYESIAGTTVFRTPSFADPRDYQAKGDLRQITDGAMTSGSAVLSSASQYVFTSLDVGKQVLVYNAQAANVPLVTSISSVTGGNATLAVGATNTISGATVLFGTDDTVAINAAIVALNAIYLATGKRQTLQFGDADYLVSYQTFEAPFYYAAIILLSGVVLVGTGLSRIAAFPVPFTLATGSYSLSSTPSNVPVLNTAGFINLTGFGQEFVVNGNTVGWTSLTSTQFTGCTLAGTYSGSVGDIITFRKYTSLIWPSSAGAIDWAVRNLTLDGQSFTQVESGNPAIQIGVNTTSITYADFDVSDCEILNFLGKGIDLLSASGSPAKHFRVQRNNIHACVSNAIGLDGYMQDFEIIDNFLHDINASGAESIVGATNISRGIVARNIVDNYGTICVGGTDMLYANNYVNATSGAAGPVMQLIAGNTRVRVIGNTIDGSASTTSQGLYGVVVCTDLIVADNHIIAADIAGYEALSIGTGSTGSFSVVNNTVVCPSGPASYLFKGSGADVVVTGNRLSGLLGGTGGFEFVGATSLTCTGNIVHGGLSSITATLGGTVTGNQFIGDIVGTNSALYVSGIAVVISGNVINYYVSSGGAPGLEMNGATYCAVTGNTFISAAGSNNPPFGEENSSDHNVYSQNTFYAADGYVTSPIVRGSLGSHSACFDNYLIVGADAPLDQPSSQPSVPASGTAYVNAVRTNCMVYVTGGAVTGIAINAEATGLTSGGFRVKVGHSITLTYSVAPTWYWIGE